MDEQIIMNAMLDGNSQALVKDLTSFNSLAAEAQKSFFTREGELRVFDLPKRFKRGQCGSVHLLDGDEKIVFKKYFPETTDNLKIKVYVFDLLRSLNHPNSICPLEDFYHSQYDGLNNGLIAAYTYYYVVEENVDFMNIGKDYLVYNFHKMEELLNRVSEEHILMADLKNENTVLNSERIVLMDPDCWIKRENMDVDLIKKLNKRELLKLMRDLLACKSSGVFLKRNAYTLFSLDLEDEKDMASVVAKRLWFKKTMKDYLK